MDIIQALKEELQIGRNQVEAAVKLIDEGNTIPFIARYRKEATGSLNDEVLRQLDERLRYLRNLDKAFEVKEVLSNFRVKVDDSDKSPGWKFSESEMRGIPVRVEIGPRDIAENQAVLVRRDTHEKITVSLDEIAAKVGELLETIHHDMFERAKAHRDSHTYVATTLDEMKEIAENKPGFIKAMWCGNQECEDKLKEVVGVTSRCIPFNQEHLADTCVCCGKPATKMVYWGKAY